MGLASTAGQIWADTCVAKCSIAHSLTCSILFHPVPTYSTTFLAIGMPLASIAQYCSVLQVNEDELFDESLGLPGSCPGSDFGPGAPTPGG